MYTLDASLSAPTYIKKKYSIMVSLQACCLPLVLTSINITNAIHVYFLPLVLQSNLERNDDHAYRVEGPAAQTVAVAAMSCLNTLAVIEELLRILSKYRGRKEELETTGISSWLNELGESYNSYSIPTGASFNDVAAGSDKGEPARITLPTILPQVFNFIFHSELSSSSATPSFAQDHLFTFCLSSICMAYYTFCELRCLYRTTTSAHAIPRAFALSPQRADVNIIGSTKF